MRSRGFTLVELLLVLTILGILAGGAVTMRNTDAHELDATARQVAADLLQAQQLAIAHRLPIGLSFDDDFTGPTFVLADGTALADAETTLRARSDLDSQAVDRLLVQSPRTASGLGPATAVAGFGGSDLVVFAADGTPSAGGTVQLTLGKSVLNVRCAPVTGRVAVTAP